MKKAVLATTTAIICAGVFFQGASAQFSRPSNDAGKVSSDKKVDVPQQRGEYSAPSLDLVPLFLLRGEKYVEVSFQDAIVTRPEYYPEGVKQGLDFKQGTRISAKSKFSKNLIVDIDHDDGAPDGSMNRLLISYLGSSDSAVQEITFGDMTLDLPGFRYLEYTQKTSVEKGVLGVKGVFRAGAFRFTVLGSQTKGETAAREFSGKADERTHIISDTGYARYKYFLLETDPANLPLKDGSVKVYIDDGNGYNNTAVTIKMTPSGAIKEGYYDEIKPVADYFIDHRTGVLTLVAERGMGQSIAASYQTALGVSVGLILVKSEDDSVSGELKNRYDLPPFEEVLKVDIYDLSQNRLTVPAYTIDPVNGVLVFDSTVPFAAETYAVPPIRNLEIAVTMRSKTDGIVLGESVIKGSEKIYLNDELLKPDMDYLGMPAIGKFDLFRPFSQSDKIRIEYERAGYASEKLVSGVATTYEKDALSFGVSGLASWTPGVKEVPQIGSTPKDLKLGGAFFKHSFEPARGLKIFYSADGAVSEHNPNPFGYAMLDNFEGAGTYWPIEIAEKYWIHSSVPAAATGLRTKQFYSISSEYWSRINPKVSGQDKTNVISFTSELGKWAGFFRGFEGAGANLRRYEYLEAWVRSDTGSGEINFDWGLISEDINGNGALDTEDINADGLLNPGEDTGIRSDGMLIGRNDNLLTTEDVDHDGRLNTANNYKTIKIPVTWTGWKKIIVPLGSARSSQIKHFRAWSQNTGAIGLADVKFTGSAYTVYETAAGTFTLRAVSNYSDPAYKDIIGTDIYARFYPEEKPKNVDDQTYQAYRRREGSLLVEFDLPGLGSAVAVRPSPANIEDYDSLKVMLYSGGAAASAEAFLRLGDANNYYEWMLPLNRPGEWVTLDLAKPAAKSVGSPKWSNLSQIFVGVRNQGATSAAGSFYLNELYASGVIVRRGIAGAARLRGEYRSIYAEAEGERVSPEFRPMTGLAKGRRGTRRSAGTTNPLFPASVSENESFATTQDDNNRLSEDYDFSREALASFVPPRLPRLNAKYARNKKETFAYAESRTLRELGVEYDIPLKANYLPNRIEAAGSLEEDEVNLLDTSRARGGFTWTINTGLPVFRAFKTMPGYEQEISVSTSSAGAVKESYRLQIKEEIEALEWLNFAAGYDRKFFYDIRLKFPTFSYNVIEGKAAARISQILDTETGAETRNEKTSPAIPGDINRSFWSFKYSEMPAPEVDMTARSVYTRNTITPFSSRGVLSPLGFRAGAKRAERDTIRTGTLENSVETEWPDAGVFWRTEKFEVSAGLTIKNTDSRIEKSDGTSVPVSVFAHVGKSEWRLSHNYDESTTKRDGVGIAASRKNKTEIGLRRMLEEAMAIRIPYTDTFLRGISKTNQTLSLDHEDERGYSGNVEINRAISGFSGAIEYFLVENFGILFNCGLNYLNDKISPSRNYLSYRLSAGTKIIF